MVDTPSQRRWRLTTAEKLAKFEGPTFDIRRIVGRGAFHAASHVGRIAYLCVEIVRGLKEVKVWVPRAFEQGVHVGLGSLFIVLLTAAFAGGVTSLQAGYQFTGNIPIYVAAGVITQSIILELGPVLTALILSGRIGARYAAELGTMRVTEQIDALESLGRSSVSHLIIPRVVAGTLMLPVLVIFANLFGIWAGWVGARISLDITNYDFQYGARFFFKPFDLYYSMVKSFFFGLAITIVPCYMGFSTKQGAEGVGRATTGAVVSASVTVLFLDVLLAQLLLS
jgi:phospholipid/cholesterol/gamma-HCH transport system permease protein